MGDNEYLQKLLLAVDKAKKEKRIGVYRISEKVNDSTIFYVKDYFAKYVKDCECEFKKCTSCQKTWDIMIIIRY